MKLTILFIVMQLLTLQVIRANDLWQDHQKEEVVEQQQQEVEEEQQQQELEQRQAVALHQEEAPPWRTSCMRQCVEDMIPTTNRSADCQRYEREFDCSLHCVFEVPIH